MKNVLIFFAIITFVVRPFLGFKKGDIKKKMKDFKNEMIQCILKSGKASAELKSLIEKETVTNLKEILHSFISKIDSNDREIIQNCRKELFHHFKENVKGRFNKIISSPIFRKGIKK